MTKITKNQIKNVSPVIQNILESGTIHLIDLEDSERNIYTPDIIIYLNGPKCWAELSMLEDGNYRIEDYKILENNR